MPPRSSATLLIIAAMLSLLSTSYIYAYDIRVLNLVDLSQSDGYNPFRYLRDEKDALKLVNTLIQATTPKGSHESDPFWSKSETALLQAIILMLFQEAPEYEQNFSMVMRDRKSTRLNSSH